MSAATSETQNDPGPVVDDVEPPDTVATSPEPEQVATVGKTPGRVARFFGGVSTLHRVVLALSAVVLVAAAALAWQARSLADDPAVANRALLDEAQGDGLVAAVSRGLAAVFSYDHKQPEATRARADQLLDGQARAEFDTLFASLQERAPGQKLVLSSNVQVAAVQEMSADKASLLVFLDQRSTRAGDKEATVSAAQLSIVTERRGKQWKITELKVL